MMLTLLNVSHSTHCGAELAAQANIHRNSASVAFLGLPVTGMKLPTL